MHPGGGTDPSRARPPCAGPSATLQTLARRAELLWRLRLWFRSHGFLEVTTPVLSPETVVDLHLDPLRVTLFDDPRHPEEGPTWYLQTSPEFCMKRLLAAGAEAIFQVTPAFRGAEIGPRHNVEFTMVEWYRVGDTMVDGMRRLSDLIAQLAACPPAALASYRDTFAHYLGFDPLCADPRPFVTAAQPLRPAAAADSLDELRSLLWSHFVEPQLGQDQPVIIYDYPASEAALAVVRNAQPPVAERFELYYCGIELANGYHELTDVSEFQRRQAETNDQRARAGKPRLPEARHLVAAMRQGLPPSTGVALGFDRLAMLLLGENNLEKVLAFSQKFS